MGIVDICCGHCGVLPAARGLAIAAALTVAIFAFSTKEWFRKV